MVKPCSETLQTAGPEWVMFPGGELEGKRPRALCPACRERLKRAATQAIQPVRDRQKPICFQCYRAELERDSALRAAGQLETASDARFQYTLPFDPVDPVRLAFLKAERAAERQARRVLAGLSTVTRTGVSQVIEPRPGVSQVIEPRPGVSQVIERCADRRRQAQIAARHALQAIRPAMSERAMVAAIHAAELQLPESWLPFVVSR
jgi:hypothetical protein